MKICKDCRFFQIIDSAEYPKCGHKGALDDSKSLVFGGDSGAFFCETMRMSEEGCGKEGKWWEAK